MEFFGIYDTSIKRAFSEITEDWESYEGIVIAGSHNYEEEETEKIIKKIRNARIIGTPLYGECWGFQLCAVEFARNVLGIRDASSEEWGWGTYVVKKRKNGLNVGLKNGESYWNNFEVDLPDWNIPPNFFIAQYHASYQSSLIKKHPLIISFLKYARQYSKR